MAPSPEAFPWHTRRSVAVWRGTCTGRGAIQSVRLAVARTSRKQPGLVDAVLFPCGACASLLRHSPALFGNVSEGLVQADYARYKYVIDLDGDGCSGRLGKLLTSGAVLLKPWLGLGLGLGIGL